MKIKESLGRDVMRLAVWYPLRWLVALLPFSWALFLFERMGDIHYALYRGHRRMLRDSLRRAFKNRAPREIEDMARDILRTRYVDRMIVFLFPRIKERNFRDLVEVEGLEILKKNLAGGKGAVLVHPHFGPSQLLIFALAFSGYPVTQIGNRRAEDLSFIGRNVQMRLRLKYESGVPAVMYHMGTYFRQIIRNLDEGHLVLISGDGAGENREEKSASRFPFLGSEMYFPHGPVKLALHSRVPLIPLFLLPSAGGGRSRYRAVVLEPIELHKEKGMEYNMQHYVRLLESYISRYPGMWHFWYLL